MFKDKEIGFVIQARLGSSRLPGKALLYYGGTTVVGYLIKSLLENGVEKELLCVTTSTSSVDDVLAEYITELGVTVVRGDEENVLSRYQKAASETGFKNIVRLTGDNPLIDTDLVFYCISKHLQGGAALTTTRKIERRKVTRYAPKGLSVDVINSGALLSIDTSGCNKFETEHVIPFFYENFPVQVVKDFVVKASDSSIDTIEDYARLFKL